MLKVDHAERIGMLQLLDAVNLAIENE